MGEDVERAVLGAVREFMLGRLQSLVLVGEWDRVEPESSVRKMVVRKLEDAGGVVEVVRLKCVGHLVPVEARSELAEMMTTFTTRSMQLGRR